MALHVIGFRTPKNQFQCLSLIFCVIIFFLGCTVRDIQERQLPVSATSSILPHSNPWSTPSDDICNLPALENVLYYYRQLAEKGGWPSIPVGQSLRQGDRDDRIPLLRQRLSLTGDLDVHESQSDVFDEILLRAIRKFQKRHGLEADGVVGTATIGQLNVSVHERLKQIIVNLNNCRLHKRFFPPRYILINIPDFSLQLYEHGQLRLSMPVIVGKPERPTPVLKGEITSIVINPDWKVPRIIATEDILPKIRKDPMYLEKSNISVLKTWNSDENIDPSTIDWKSLSPDNFPYHFCQHPGPDNSLGRLKFLFPNPFDIYLHDTPARYLFNRNPRAFSSGCIRLAKAKALAVYLLQGTSVGSIGAINSAIAGGKTKHLSVPSPIPIYIIYVTAWVDHDGIVQFRPDIYHRNPAL